ncbi:MAG TPA: M1 family metallopeptidase [Kofleriaceae bacterium]|nr:M1 family metallopeptidase [Kofleriaceae bacterium]
MRAALLAVLAACASPEPRRPRPAAPAAPAAAATAPARAAAPTAARDPAPPALRLPGDVRPTRYALDLTIIPEQPTAAGRIHIAAEVVRATRVVWLNATGLAIEHAALGGRPARVIPGGDDFLGLAVGRELPPGPLEIDVEFTAPIDRERSRGLYSEREGSEAYAYTFFEPIDARRAFPCFDEPGYKVPWQLTLHVRQGHVALGNAEVAREAPEPGGMKRVELAVSRPLPSYLVAFVVGPFELVDGGKVGRVATPIRFVIPRGRAGELGYARQVTPKVVAALEDYFATAYPYGKLDVAVVPRFWGTMEHPGIVAMGQPLTLIRPDQDTRARRQGYANILAHELSHYWFGDLVTMAWWDDTWLNEALGEWSDMNITEAAEPTWRLRDERVGMAVRAMRADETLATHAIRRPVATREAIEASFDGAITYFKGASMFRMFESFVGRDAWRGFLQRYLAAHAWGNASADDFLAGVADQLGAAQAAAMRSFLEQPGVPRIAGRLRCDRERPPRLELSQTRALPAGVTDPEARRWGVPVCVRHGDARPGVPGARQCFLLAAESAVVELAPAGGPARCPAWMILNADAIGYYRSAVDPAIAGALLTPGSAIARAARPTPAERMMLVEDLRGAVERGELALDKLLELVPLIAADPDDKVARSALVADAIPTSGLTDAMYQAARRWSYRAFRARARQLGWQRAAGEPEERHELRRELVPVVAALDPALTAEARRLADLWLARRTGVPDDLADEVLAAAARHGDAARFDRYLAAAGAARDRAEHARLLSALGEFDDPGLVNRALALVLAPEHDLRDAIGIVTGVLARRETRELGLAFLTVHLDELLARMRSDEASLLLAAIAGAFCDIDHRRAIAALVVPRAAKLDGAQASVSRALEQADQCIALVDRQLPALRHLLAAP